ncbi:MAG: YpdA family putative bacillithiol disulfide reductase [Candidatus Hinthialibacter antarcticus]|nr:YpdA family putative bacillithiol disulfide reductase [Candidatus Hinthialibacter antarcticus]
MSAPRYDIAIVGAGPIGLACALEAKARGLSHCIFDKGCLANSIYHYPTSMRFFSTPDLLEIGGLPFTCRDEKPVRWEALEYYRRVAETQKLRIHLYEEVANIKGEDGQFELTTPKGAYQAAKVIVAAGFFEKPQMLNVPGEELAKVVHFYKEPHPYVFQKVLVVGNGNSATQTALECWRHSAEVTLAVRGDGIKPGVKYWIKPDIENRIELGEIKGYFNTVVQEIKPDSVVLKHQDGTLTEIENDFVLAMTGYEPNYDFMRRIGIAIGDDPMQTPVHDPVTYETNRPGVFLAGVVCGGMQTNRWFIENSRCHADGIFERIQATLPGA